MPVRAAASSRRIPLPAAVAAFGLAITTAVTVARTAPLLDEDRPGIAVVTLDDLHEGQVEIAAAMVLTLVAAVLWGRVHRAPTRRNLLLFISFCVLAVDSFVSALFTAGFDSLSASHFAAWGTAATGLLGSVILVLAAWLPDEPLRDSGRSVLVTAILAAAAVAGALVLAWVFRGHLPDSLETPALLPADLRFLSAHPLLIVEAMGEAACWAIASVLLASSSRRTGDDLTRWLAIGAVLVALAGLNYALLPSHLVELMYLGDYFFLGAVAVLLFGAVREVGLAEAALVDRAVYAERRRIAREMHDGVTQELAFIASQALAARESPERTTGALQRIRDAVERALDQSRAAIAELSGPVDESLAASIATTVEVVSRRTGTHVDLAVDESLVESDAVRGALVRVTRDALTLAHRQGASTVGIRVRRNGVLSLRIVYDAEWTGSVDESQWAAATASIRDTVAGVDGQMRLSHEADGTSTLEVQVP